MLTIVLASVFFVQLRFFAQLVLQCNVLADQRQYPSRARNSRKPTQSAGKSMGTQFVQRKVK